MIERNARLAGAAVRRVPWLEGPFPLADYTGALSPAAALAALVTPNNPTGQAVPTQHLDAVVAAAADVGAAVLLDLAYAEFADEDPAPRLLHADNVVIIRTFSKAFGLAGLRIGYAVAPPRIADWLRTVGSPFPTSPIAVTLAGLALDDPRRLAEIVDRTRRERATLAAHLAAHGIHTIPSQANFLCLPRPPLHLAARLRERGIAVRAFAEDSPAAGCVRIALPADDDDFARLTAAVNAVCQETRT